MSARMPPMPKEVREAFNFRPLEASMETMTFFQNAKKAGGGDSMDCLPVIDTAKKTITRPTHLKHFKFAIRSWASPTTESNTFVMLISFLIEFYGYSPEFFKGHGVMEKCGLLSFPDNENSTSIRLWTSKQVGKSVIYELSVSGYKDAVPEPLKELPTTKVVVKDE